MKTKEKSKKLKTIAKRIKVKAEKKMKLWHYLLLLAAAMLLIGGFFLPNAVAGITDSRMLDNLITIDSQSISFNSAPDLVLPERIELVANPKTEILPLKTGNAMDLDEAKEKADRELARFLRGSPFRFNFSGYEVEEGDAALVVESADPAHNLIIWEFVLIDQSENKVTVTIDDETGFILRLIYKLGNKGDPFIEERGPGSPDDRFVSAAQSLADMMKDYYGLRVTLADYKLSGNGSIAYYRADLPGGNRVIPMYGAIRSTSFTMNERVRE